MASFCKHVPHKVIDWIREPKYSTGEILIKKSVVSDKVDHYIIQFSAPVPQKTYGWFYLPGKVIRKSKTQPNGRGEVYAVSLDKREVFEPLTKCIHLI